MGQNRNRQKHHHKLGYKARRRKGQRRGQCEAPQQKRNERRNARPKLPRLAPALPVAQVLAKAANSPPTLAGVSTPQAIVQKGSGDSARQPETALFERRDEVRSDARLVKRAVRHRWETNKALSRVVIEKALTLAAGLPWRGPDGKESRMDFSAPQLLGAGDLALKVESQNISQEHHDERMDYAERALQMRAKVGDYRPSAGFGQAVKVETDGAATVSIYLPARDEDDSHVDAMLAADQAGQ